MIGKALFKKETKIQSFVGLKVQLSTGEFSKTDLLAKCSRNLEMCVLVLTQVRLGPSKEHLEQVESSG